MKFERFLYLMVAFISLAALSGCFYTSSTVNENQAAGRHGANANGAGMTDQEACNYYCGEGFKYDRPGGKNRGRERVCTRYPLSCGYQCTTGWDIHHLVNGSNYTCQTAVQQAEVVTTESRGMTDQEACNYYCGEGFKYDRPGGKNGGRERVCTRYPLSCGYQCTSGWDIQYLVNGSDYTCQTAVQNAPNAPNVPSRRVVRETTRRVMTDQEACIYYCGEGFKYDRPGGKNGGRERVCTRYPLPCGYQCTSSWDIQYLVNGSNYTCQTAIQH